MTTVLDSGGVTALAKDRALVNSLRKRGAWPPVVPAAVLVESLTGDHRLDFHTNRLLRLCEVRPVTELMARHAAALRHACRRDGVSAVDAIVVAAADQAGGGVVWTSDPDDIAAVACNTIDRVATLYP
jgi:predicted nucleic acid-binding protein